MKWTVIGVALFVALFSVFFAKKMKAKGVAKEVEAAKEKLANDLKAKEKNLAAR